MFFTQDSEFHSFFGRIEDVIICCRDLLNFNISTFNLNCLLLRHKLLSGRKLNIMAIWGKPQGNFWNKFRAKGSPSETLGGRRGCNCVAYNRWKNCLCSFFFYFKEGYMIKNFSGILPDQKYSNANSITFVTYYAEFKEQNTIRKKKNDTKLQQMNWVSINYMYIF